MEFRFRACDVERSRPLVPPPVASAAAKEDEQLMKERLRAEIRKEVEAELLAMSRGNERMESPPVSLLGASSVQSPHLVEDGPPALTTSGAKRKQLDDASEKSLEEHLSVKRHKKEVLSDAATSGELLVEEHLSVKRHKKEVLSDAAASGELSEAMGIDSYKPSKLAMQTSDGKMYYVLQMDGYLLCELCNVRATDRVTMMCHLQGGKHISKVKTQHHDIAAADAKEKRATQVALSTDAHNAITMEVDGVAHSVLRMEGYLVCDLCKVRTDNEVMIRSHLGGKKHKSKAMAAPTVVGAKKEVAPTVVGVEAKKEVAIETATLEVEGDASMTKDKNETNSTAAPSTDLDTSMIGVSLASAQEKTIVIAGTGDTDMSVEKATMMGEDFDAKTDMCYNESSQYIALEQANGELFCEAMATDKPRVESPHIVEDGPLALTTSGAKRKQPDDAGEKSQDEHLSVKRHKKQVFSDASTTGELPAAVGVDSYKPSKLAMQTSDGKMYYVLQMDGYLLCELCNVRATDRVTMMCHLQGGKHISKVKTQHHDIAAADAKEKRATQVALSTDAHNAITMEVDGVAHSVLRMEGYLSCDLCNVRADTEAIMRSHLAGKRHKNRAMAAPTIVSVEAKKVVTPTVVCVHAKKEVATETVTLEAEGDVSMTKDKNETNSTAVHCTDMDTSMIGVSLASAQEKTVDVESTGDIDMSVGEATTTDTSVIDVSLASAQEKTVDVANTGDTDMPVGQAAMIDMSVIGVSLASAQEKNVDATSSGDTDMPVGEATMIDTSVISVSLASAQEKTIDVANTGGTDMPVGQAAMIDTSVIGVSLASVQEKTVDAASTGDADMPVGEAIMIDTPVIGVPFASAQEKTVDAVSTGDTDMPMGEAIMIDTSVIGVPLASAQEKTIDVASTGDKDMPVGQAAMIDTSLASAQEKTVDIASTGNTDMSVGEATMIDSSVIGVSLASAQEKIVDVAIAGDTDMSVGEATMTDMSVIGVSLASALEKIVDVASIGDTDMSVGEATMMCDAKPGMCQNECLQYIALEPANGELFCETATTDKSEMPSVESPQVVEAEPPTLTTSGSKRKQPDDALPALSEGRSSKKQRVEQSMGDAATNEPAVADSHTQSKLAMQTTDRVTMMCHLQGGKHMSKIKGMHHDEAATETKQEAVMPVAAGVSSPEPTIAMEVDGTTHAVLKMQGYLFCNRCNVRADGECVMRAHLRGKKHKSKTKASTTIAVRAQAGKEVAMAQAGGIAMSKNETNFAAVTDTVEEQKEVVAPSTLTQAKATNVAITGDAETSANEAAKMGDVTGRMVKFMVEGIVYTVVEEANGALFCVPCGVRRGDTYGMSLHMYTDMHRRECKRYRGNGGNGMP